MARPVYIICSESGSVDRYTNQVSIFNVIERLRFRRAEDGEPPAGDSVRRSPWLQMRVISVWERESGDAESEFDYRVHLMRPGQEEPQQIGEGQFVFGDGHLHRIFMDVGGPPPNTEGEIVITVSVKKSTDQEWIEHSYTIPVAAESVRE